MFFNGSFLCIVIVIHKKEQSTSTQNYMCEPQNNNMERRPISLFINMQYTCVCRLTRECMHTCRLVVFEYMCMWRPNINIRNLPQLLFSLSSEAGSLNQTQGILTVLVQLVSMFLPCSKDCASAFRGLNDRWDTTPTWYVLGAPEVLAPILLITEPCLHPQRLPFI